MFDRRDDPPPGHRPRHHRRDPLGGAAGEQDRAAPAEKIGDPHEEFYKHCFIAFESDEIVTLRLWDIYENIALWSSDMPHLDASDVWEAIDNMNKWQVPQGVQEKMLGGNARRLYGIEPELVVTKAPENYKPQIMSRYA